jgi:serine phosphatase RsbU (regulator of sigma subunit)
VLCCALALLPASVVGWQIMETVRTHFGAAYARNTTLLNRDKMFGQVWRELALSRRLAGSDFTRQWMLDDSDPAKRETFFREAEGFRRDFYDHSYWAAVGKSRTYYFNNDNLPFSDRPRATLDAANPTDAWFFNSLQDSDPFNLNVDNDANLNLTKIWFNVAVYDQGRKLGMAGTGLDLTTFLHDFARGADPGVTPMIIDRQGAIQAHPDERLIAYNSGSGKVASRGTRLFDLLAPGDAATARQAMQAAEGEAGGVQVSQIFLGGRSQMLAVTYVPELKWFVVSAVDLEAARLVGREWLMPLSVALAVLLAALLGGFALAVDRLVLRPINRLQESAQAIASGSYEVRLPVERRDEIGQLSRAFRGMAEQVRRHTNELEGKVEERTAELRAAYARMTAAHQQIDDSIRYASLIQRAILPSADVDRASGLERFVLWRPRDVVGGDFYLARQTGNGFLFGLADCAGHGVAGALMTMLGHAAIDRAVNAVPPGSPAAILTAADVTLRSMLQDGKLPSSIAASMDAGLCYMEPNLGVLTFAGAKIPLFWSDGNSVGEVKAGSRALNDRRRGNYTDVDVPLLRGRTFYLLSDGFIDQAGGEHGFAFGTRRLKAMLREHAGLPLAEQASAFEDILARYRKEMLQRDDVTVFFFQLA